MRKLLSFALVAVLTASSVLWTESTSAQTIPKPSIPESFQIGFSSHPYDVAPKTAIDPYTGKSLITEGGYHNENKTVEFTIKNQPFTPYTDTEGHSIGLYYKISFKGHYTDDWSEYGRPLPASNTDYTLLSIRSDTLNVPSSGLMDFRIQAGIGYVTSFEYFMDGYMYTLNGETSDWSNTQTVTIGDIGTSTAPTALPTQPSSAPTASPTGNPTANPAQPDTQTGVLFGLDWQTVVIIVLVVVVVVLAVGMFGLWRKVAATKSSLAS